MIGSVHLGNAQVFPERANNRFMVLAVGSAIVFRCLALTVGLEESA
ncbi:MAG: hypothetical protein OJF48_004941 [Afipia sp.]|jgi:hypothetical protein|nr:MAG: hypothetical protein OJF48_004941 [Afipia sp.]